MLFDGNVLSNPCFESKLSTDVSKNAEDPIKNDLKILVGKVKMEVFQFNFERYNQKVPYYFQLNFPSIFQTDARVVVQIITLKLDYLDKCLIM